ncbi:protein phosphatase 1 regulatory subunit 15A [Callithrix jacchus]
MAPGQAPHQAAGWRDAHPFFLLSPLMGFLSWAWSRLRGPGPPEPWLVEAVKGAEAGLEGEAETPLTTPATLWDRYSEEEAEDSGGPEGDREAMGLKTSTSLPEAWGLSDDDDDKYSEREATSVPRGQGSQLADGQRAPLSPSLLIRTLQGSDKNPGEEKAEEEGVAEDEGVNSFSYPPSHRECSAVEEEDEEACRASTALSPGSKPSAWVSCPGEEENQATEDDGRTEKSQGARKTPVSPPSSGSNPTAWEYHSGETSEEKEKAHEGAGKGKAAPGPHSSAPAQRPQLRAWPCQPTDEEEGEVKALGAAEKDGGADPPCIPATSAFPKAWVYQPGEDTEEEEEKAEDEDSDTGSAEDRGEAETSASTSPSSAFLKVWVYGPGEDTEEEEGEEEDKDSDSGSDEEGGAEGSSSTPATGTFLKSWVFQPEEDTEEEDEDSDTGSAEDEGEAENSASTPPASAFLKSWVYQPGEDTEEEDEDEGEAENSASTPPASAFLKSWVYQPGEDTEEEDEDEGEAETSASTPPASAFLKSWVYRPGENTEEEDEDEDSEDKEDDSEAAVGETESNPHPSHPAQSARFRDWVYQPGKETEEEEATEYWGEAEPCPFRVAIYVPGEKSPPPWALPGLPHRLQRRLKHPESPTRDPDPETPLKARKVRFSEKVTVHLLAVWAGPAHAARRGPWEQLARDRSRFARRIAQAQELLSPCLTPAARARAWARLRNPPLAPIPALTETLPSSSVPSSPVQATPLSQAVATPSPSCLAPLDLSGRRG